MVKDIEREAPARVPVEVRAEEVISPSEEVPSMVELDAPQHREPVLVVSRAESIVGSGRYQDGSHANCTNYELIFLTGDGMEGGRVNESRHWVGTKGVK